ncbi:MAG: hypothetical protein IT285_03665 [Bdellovibrionales bacterium]|nr:hypothetical protein [Bdellovibrionales bacterium]
MSPLLLAAILSSPSFARILTETQYIQPEAIFVKESTHVTVHVKAEGLTAEPILAEIDSNGRVIQYLGNMNDTGRWGDRLKNDGTYAKKFQVHRKLGMTLHYAVFHAEDARDFDPTKPETAPVAPASARIALEVLGRPSWLQAMGQVWEKLSRGRAADAPGY